MNPILAADPLLADGVGLPEVLIVILKVVIAFALLLIGTMFMVWFERKAIAGMQNRVGPNKAGPWGILQTLADGMKLIFKESLRPEKADHHVYRIAPYLAFLPAFLTFTVVPIGGDYSDGSDGTVSIFGYDTYLQLADPPMGVLIVFALSSIAVYGTMLAGWSSGSKYPLLGSVRATGQMVSYEAALGLSLAAVLLLSGTLTTSGIVTGQDGLRNWNLIATGFVPFFIFFVAITAELKRPPFDLTEAEQELTGGFHTEYSAFSFALFYLAEFMGVITMSAVMITLFLGGPQPLFPVPFLPGVFEGILWFLAKLLLFLYVFVWLRGTLPRFRYDQLMDLGWKVMIPVAFAWFMLLTALKVAQDDDWSVLAITVGGVVVLAVLLASFALFQVALRVAARNREAHGTVF